MVAVSSVVFKIKRGNLGNARKKTFFLQELFPKGAYDLFSR